ncbi:MAG TPA: alkaline phosphatase family protein [Verrucomicrobiae bacterium]|nr:alkaline phosphatase family protein [Verrucomicrobiae bacterium]
MAFAPFAQASGGKARHVVVVVWDGMRPDFITPANTPTLYKLAQEGARFDNHHPVFLSSTEVNGTAIATGGYPARDGIVGNVEFRPEIDATVPVHTEELETVRKGDQLMRGHYISLPTIAEILHQKGMHTAIAGAKGVALLHDRAERPTNATNVDLFAGATVPPNIAEEMINLHGQFPAASSSNYTRNDWTTESLIDPLWKDGVPPFSLLWMNEPDLSQHQTGPGSAKSLAAIKNADDNLARVLHALEDKGVRNDTDILLVSDHGFSTILSSVDLAESLRNAGFKATRKFGAAPNFGDIMVAGDGGAVLLYVAGHDRGVTEKLVNFLQGWKETGVIFSRRSIEGTFALSQVHLDSPGAPDVAVSLRWTPDKNDNGTPGMEVSDVSSYGPGGGMHGTLSPFDMHNTFVANGPDFRAGIVDHLPTGNVDIAPTVLWILGVKPPKRMDGRVVTEALVNAESKIKSFEPHHIEVSHALDGAVWHQYLNYTEVNGVDYFDEGNGFQTAK